MGAVKEIAFLFYEGYWNVLTKLPTRRKRCDMCGALVEAFFTGESCADRFKGETLAVYLQLEDRMFHSRKKAFAGREGGKQSGKQNASKVPSKAQANHEATMQATSQANHEATGQANTQAKRKQSAKPKEKEKEKENLPSSVCVLDTFPDGQANTHTTQEFTDFFIANGSTTQAAKRFMQHYAAQGWKRSNGLEIVDWHPLALMWIDGDGKTEPPKTAYPETLDCPSCGIQCSPIADNSPVFRCDSCGITWRAE